jgi:hypothetical protein
MLVLLAAGVLCADGLVLASHVALGHSIAEFASYGDAPEFLSNAQVFGASGPHFPGYGWLLYLLNALTARTIHVVVLALGVNIACQVLSACLIYRLGRFQDLEPDKAVLAALLMTCFPFQSLFLTVLPLSDALKLFLVTSAFYSHKKKSAFMTILLTAALVSTRNVFVLTVLGLSLFYLVERNWRLFLLSTLALLPAVFFVLYQYWVTGDALHYIQVKVPACLWCRPLCSSWCNSSGKGLQGSPRLSTRSPLSSSSSRTPFACGRTGICLPFAIAVRSSCF